MHNSWSRVLNARHLQYDDNYYIPSNRVVSHSLHMYMYNSAPIINGKLLDRLAVQLLIKDEREHHLKCSKSRNLKLPFNSYCPVVHIYFKAHHFR